VRYVMMLIAVLAVAPAVAGQDGEGYRGGWRTDSGEAHVYEFSIRGSTVLRKMFPRRAEILLTLQSFPIRIHGAVRRVSVL